MRRHITLVALIDALGWTYVRQSDFLTALLPYRQPLRTVLGFSSGAIPTMLTGRTPAETGHWNLFYFDPQHSPFRWLRPFRFLPQPLLDSRYSRALLKHLGRRALGLGPLFECSVAPSLLPWFNWVEKKNIYAPLGITGARSIFDQLEEENIPYRAYSYHDGNDDALLRCASDNLRNSNAPFFFLYLCEMDAFLHQHCNDGDKVRQRLEWYERRLGKVIADAIAVDPDASIAVVSDHGMAPVTRHYDLAADVERLNLRAPAEYLAIYDSTMARFWCFHDRAREELIAVLDRVPCGRLLSEQEMRTLGIYVRDQRYGELVFLLDAGCIISRSDFNGPSWMPTGMHGYHPDDQYSDGIFLARHAPRQAPRWIADVYSWMAEAVEQYADAGTCEAAR